MPKKLSTNSNIDLKSLQNNQLIKLDHSYFSGYVTESDVRL
jgi:hypothetical protein